MNFAQVSSLIGPFLLHLPNSTLFQRLTTDNSLEKTALLAFDMIDPIEMYEDLHSHETNFCFQHNFR